MIRAGGIMTDKQYNDRRCNKCGHLWTVGDTLELPFRAPGNKPVRTTKGESGDKVPPPEESAPDRKNPPLYDFGDGWVPEVEDIPF